MSSTASKTPPESPNSTTCSDSSSGSPKHHLTFSKETIAQFGYQASDLEADEELADTLAELISRNTKKCAYCSLDMSDMRGRSRRSHVKSCEKRFQSYRMGEKPDFRASWHRTSVTKRGKDGQLKK